MTLWQMNWLINTFGNVSNIKLLAMQTARLVQAVIVMLIVALAASCAVTKEYSSKLFAPRTTVQKDSQSFALRFLEIDNNEKSTEDWVTTDIIRGIDTAISTASLDNLAKTLPSERKKDSVQVKNSDKQGAPMASSSEKDTPTDEPVAKTTNTNGVRSKKTREE